MLAPFRAIVALLSLSAASTGCAQRVAEPVGGAAAASAVPPPGGVPSVKPRAASVAGWPFCPLRVPPGPVSDTFEVELPDDCEVNTASLTPCPGAEEATATLRRCCKADGDDRTLCQTKLGIGQSVLALETENVGSNSTEGDFDYYQNELESISLGHGVQAVVRRYSHSDIGGLSTVTYDLYAWNGSSIKPILTRSLKYEHGQTVMHEEKLRFEPRPESVADLSIDAYTAADPPDPERNEHLELRFKDGRYH